MDTTGMNSTSSEFDDSDGFFGDADKHRGRLPSQMSSSGYGSGPIKNVNGIFISHDE